MTRLEQYIKALEALSPHEGQHGYVKRSDAITLANDIFGAPVTEEEIKIAAQEIDPAMTGRGSNYSEIAMEIAKSQAKAVLEMMFGEKNG